MYSDTLSYFAYGLIGLMALSTLYFHIRYTSKVADHVPSLLTSAGIFGTFVGISIGLYHFDSTDIQTSVPGLLNGLKTAFWSSIAGLFCALTIKIRQSMYDMNGASEKTKETVSPSDMLEQLKQISHNTSAEYEFNPAVAIQSLEDNLSAKLTDMASALVQYQEDMAKANADALVDAIRTVMRDFNVKINEQFGDNFRQLNEAVGNMLVWQKQYKDELEELIGFQKQSSELFGDVVKNIKVFVERSSDFANVSDHLTKTITIMSDKSNELKNYLEAIRTFIGASENTLPVLENRLATISEQVAQAHSGTQKQIDQMLMFSQTFLESLEENLEGQLNKSIETLGFQLTALSEKFVHDYLPLTKRLQDLVQVSKHV